MAAGIVIVMQENNTRARHPSPYIHTHMAMYGMHGKEQNRGGRWADVGGVLSIDARRKHVLPRHQEPISHQISILHTFSKTKERRAINKKRTTRTPRKRPGGVEGKDCPQREREREREKVNDPEFLHAHAHPLLVLVLSYGRSIVRIQDGYLLALRERVRVWVAALTVYWRR